MQVMNLPENSGNTYVLEYANAEIHDENKPEEFKTFHEAWIQFTSTDDDIVFQINDEFFMEKNRIPMTWLGRMLHYVFPHHVRKVYVFSALG